MARKKDITIHPWEGYEDTTVHQNRIYARIFASMINSPAWKKLSRGAMALYLIMKLQEQGQARIPEHNYLTDFYFNEAMFTKVYPLYTNRKTFRKERQELIDNGFIEYILKGKNTREKSIYRFSDKWKEIK